MKDSAMPKRRILLLLLLLVAIITDPVWSSDGGGRNLFLSVDVGKVLEGRAPVEKVTLLSGEEISLQWFFTGRRKESDICEIDLYRVLSSTVAPLEKAVPIEDPVPVNGGNAAVSGYQLILPESEAPQTFLVKLWIKRDGKKTAAHILVIHLQPERTLEDIFGGVTIRIMGDVSPSLQIVLDETDSNGDNISALAVTEAADSELVFTSVSGREKLSDYLKSNEKSSYSVVSVSLPLQEEALPTQIHHSKDGAVLVIDESRLKSASESGEFWSLVRDLLRNH